MPEEPRAVLHWDPQINLDGKRSQPVISFLCLLGMDARRKAGLLALPVSDASRRRRAARPRV